MSVSDAMVQKHLAEEIFDASIPLNIVEIKGYFRISFDNISMAFWLFCTFWFPSFHGLNLHVIIGSSGWCQGHLHDDVMLTLAGTLVDGAFCRDSPLWTLQSLLIILIAEERGKRLKSIAKSGFESEWHCNHLVIFLAGSRYRTSAHKMARLQLQQTAAQFLQETEES